MTLALAVTPKAGVSVFGQSVQVGAVPPSPGLGLSGPGEADLFGEGIVETIQHFDGPIRPLIVWQRFNRNDDAAAFIQSGSAGGHRTVATGSADVGRQLADGWTRYFGWLVATAGLLGGVLYLVTAGAVALVGRDHRRSRAAHLGLLGASVAAALVMTLGFTGADRPDRGAPARLGHLAVRPGRHGQPGPGAGGGRPEASGHRRGRHRRLHRGRASATPRSRSRPGTRSPASAPPTRTRSRCSRSPGSACSTWPAARPP